MKFIKTDIKDLVIIEPKVFGDERGYFFESYSKNEFEQNIRTIDFIQDNESKSSYGVIRGLHYQLPPFAQSKLVRVIKGRVLDVAVDIRKGSPTFGKHIAVELTEKNKKQFFIPRGFAHGFSVLSDVAIFAYKVDNIFAPDFEGSIKFDDDLLNIDWIINLENAILSEKDTNHPSITEAKIFDYNVDLYEK